MLYFVIAEMDADTVEPWYQADAFSTEGAARKFKEGEEALRFKYDNEILHLAKTIPDGPKEKTEYLSRKMAQLEVGDRCATKHEGAYWVAVVRVVELDGTYKVSLLTDYGVDEALMAREHGNLRRLK